MKRKFEILTLSSFRDILNKKLIICERSDTDEIYANA